MAHGKKSTSGAPTPDWQAEWNHIPCVSLDQACALSMNIDPHTLVFDKFDLRWEPDTDDEAVTTEYRKRLRVLSANIYGPSFTAQATNMVSISEFAIWAKDTVHWPNLPLELEELAKKASEQADTRKHSDVIKPNIPFVGTRPWIEEARRIAKEYIAMHRKQNLFPTQSDVCRHIADRMRKDETYGPQNRPLEANYIQRNAIQGKWWKENKP